MDVGTSNLERYHPYRPELTASNCAPAWTRFGRFNTGHDSDQTSASPGDEAHWDDSRRPTTRAFMTATSPVYDVNGTILSIMSSAKRRRVSPPYRPFTTIPLEVIERVFDQLPLLDLIRLRRLDRSFNVLLRSPHLFSTLHIPASPAPHPELLAMLPSLLSGTSDLTLRSFPLSALQSLLPSLAPGRLTHLDLSFSAVGDEQLVSLADEGVLDNVRVLKLKGCRGVQDGRWLSTVVPNVENLDLSWSGVSSLPSSDAMTEDKPNEGVEHEDGDLFGTSPGSDDSGYFSSSELSSSPSARSIVWPRLQHLSLSSCPRLSHLVLESFLSSLPSTLRTLNLSHLPLDYATLSSICVVDETSDLESIDLTGVDALTLSSIRQLERLWGQDVKVLHSAVLESDDEADVRRFVEWVAGVQARSSMDL